MGKITLLEGHCAAYVNIEPIKLESVWGSGKGIMPEIQILNSCVWLRLLSHLAEFGIWLTAGMLWTTY